jgi:DNA repair protein RecO (recombination protein O)
VPVHESDSIILKTYPLAEADRIVVFFSRDYGKLRGVANGVRTLKSRFGASLEPMAQSRVTFFQKETQELVRIRSTELIDSPMKLLADYDRALLASHLADLVDRFLPDHDAQDAVFRLFSLTRRSLIQGLPLDLVRCYFEVWMLRLAGVLPDLFVCSACRRKLADTDDRVLLTGLKRMACHQCGHDQGTEVEPSTVYALHWVLTNRLDAVETNDNPAALPDGEGLQHILQLNKLWIDHFYER